ncbi:ATP-binding cassette domain-containing protein [Achromobacter denitrificans]|jgi:lipoprotein-releasing system ATP-binding protein|uniref:ATP-binding cassette domain-containing protein n=1 Tax=Achromobacter denitrificans TaxID=32002 RepID=A0ABZ3GE05_ACHDE|nr:ATP-binding cassette domain-containing protein [Achromobacter denitrificans]MDX3878024.1 ATP-binding cassette domain-containing protein [Achromobacter sp.]MBV2161182.1 ATP-binding cassette domain-containing protein [Achromobacter denitrificans]MDF3860502.1 ATP-binding cassette domain-containing protein [Achromobacter denitrificans]MPT29881.1 ATP-binding cassette domain-containing protein [Achromobacter sp.]QCS65351.1 ATP-binding cassette domain-containing protein [Achromobacter denitrifican
MTDNLTPALQADNIVKVYDEGPARIEVLSNVSLSVARGEMVAIVGASGSGKSTLLHILGLLDVPTSGSVSVDGQLAVGLSESRKSAVRNRSLGFVYQFHHLLPEFSALDNVAMPLIVRRESRDRARAAAREVLGLVGLSAREGHFPGQLSGGERQRVALARALVTRPACVLADEPTGNLDRHTAHIMFELLTQVNRESGTAFAIVTHDPELAARADRQLLMENGRLVSG